MNNLIGISGKAGSGKDLVGSIIKYLHVCKNRKSIGLDTMPFDVGGDYLYGASPHIKKYADKLKDIVCLLTGCTRADLEDREFKESKLSVDWDDSHGIDTYRDLIQVLGTDCGRDIIHPNIWVNALFADYKPIGGKMIANPQPKHLIYPSWIITDVRFPNELKAIKDRGGIVIRVDRAIDSVALQKGNVLFSDVVENYRVKHHSSETALDTHAFSRIIQNDGSIEELVEKVKEIIQ